MSEVRPWLPPGTSFAKVDHEIAGIVRAWSGAWFGDDGFETSRDGSLADERSGFAAPRSCAAGAWLLVPQGGAIALARAALKIDAGVRTTRADEAVLASVGEACLTALCRALSDAFGAPTCGRAEDDSGPLARLAASRWAIVSKYAPVSFGFALSEERRIEFLLRLLPRPEPRPALAALGHALAPLAIELSANLGTCGVTLAELKSLSVGDVLVLERDIAAVSPLAIDGATAAAGACKVARDTDRLLLEISEPIIGSGT